MNDKLIVGKIGAPHGIKGEVKVFPLTNLPERFKTIKSVQINLGDEYRTYTIMRVKNLGSSLVLKLDGINDRNSADKLKHKLMEIDRSQACPLNENEYYIVDLIGLDVYEDDEFLGKLYEVIQTGAADLYSVRKNDKSKEIMIPAIAENILDIDLENKKISVKLLEGLKEL